MFSFGSRKIHFGKVQIIADTHNPYFWMDISVVASMDFYFKEKEYVISQQALLLLKGYYVLTEWNSSWKCSF